MNNESRITDIVDFNSPRKLKKGQIAPFIDMAALSTNERDIVEITEKAFTGGAKFRNGDTLFARITPCLENGKTGKVSNLSDESIGHGSTEFIVMTAKDPKIDEDYVYYLARLPEFRKFAQMRMTGTSGRQRVSWQDLAEFTFAFPEPEKRKAAGAFLKTLDDKILLNTQTNQTLEQIAQAIYKSWFVEYEPTRAKAAVLAAGGSKADAESAAMTTISGKSAAELATLKQQQPARYQQLADLAAAFPAALVPADDFGEIPAGWEISTIGESYSVVMGQSPNGETYNEEGQGTLFYQGRAEFGERFPRPRLYTTAPKRMAQKGDVMMSVRAPVGDLNVALEDCCIGRGLAALHHKSGSFSFGLYQIQSLKPVLDLFNGEGTVFGSINQKDLKAINVLQPTNTIISLFNDRCLSIDEQIQNNTRQNILLSETRDIMLPKLLNGDIEA